MNGGRSGYVIVGLLVVALAVCAAFAVVASAWVDGIVGVGRGFTFLIVFGALFLLSLRFILGTTIGLPGLRRKGAPALQTRFSHVDDMTGREFEHFMAEVFRAGGYESKVIGSRVDQGVDILLRKAGRRIAVQCKRHAKPVNNKPVQEVFSGARYHGADEAWVVAPGGYTRGARQPADRIGVVLYDRKEISRAIKRAVE